MVTKSDTTFSGKNRINCRQNSDVSETCLVFMIRDGHDQYPLCSIYVRCQKFHSLKNAQENHSVITTLPEQPFIDLCKMIGRVKCKPISSPLIPLLLYLVS